MPWRARASPAAFRSPMGGDRPTRGGASNAPAESPQAVAWYTRRRKRASNALSQVANEGFRFAERDRHGADNRGTECSNPSPSRGESAANPISAGQGHRLDARAHAARGLTASDGRAGRIRRRARRSCSRLAMTRPRVSGSSKSMTIIRGVCEPSVPQQAALYCYYLGPAWSPTSLTPDEFVIDPAP